MLPFINIFGKDIAMYGVLIFLGLIIGIIFAVYYFSRFYDIKKEDIFYSILFGIIGLGIGAKILYILTAIPSIIQNLNNTDIGTLIMQLLRGGFVFYGGLIGGILGIYIYAKVFKISFKKLLLIIVPCIPLVHAFGRIGCLLAGCCYGMEYNGFGHIIFTNTPYAPNNIPLFPSQLIEAICNTIIFIVLLVTYKKFTGTYKTIGIYCILYSIVRFTLEVFRGDAIRGIVLHLSTSQWISIILFIIGIAIFVHENKKKSKICEERDD